MELCSCKIVSIMLCRTNQIEDNVNILLNIGMGFCEALLVIACHVMVWFLEVYCSLEC